MLMKKMNRRTFLSVSATVVGGLSLPLVGTSQFSWNAAKKPKQIGVALLGLGSYSTYQLAPALLQTQHCYLAGIVTGSPEKIPTWQQRYGIKDRNVYTYDSMHEIANNEEIDVIYIVTPTGTHAQFAIAAAKTGKHVWCEKPMAMTVEECTAIIKACEQNRVGLTIGYRMQHEPNTRTMMSYVTQPPFGKIKRIDAQAGYGGGGGSGWRFQRKMGGGALYDMGVYTVNGMRYASNLFPKRVLSARQYTNRPRLFKEVDETTEYVLEFKNGLKGYGKTSVGESCNLLKVTCETGHYELSPMQSYGGVRGRRSDGVLLNKHIDNQQARQMDDDALALLEGHTMMITGEEGLQDIRIIEAIIQSAAEGRSIEI
ncbi:MAG: Gfo/Idh/MocA family oxidoreductase [Bacteroidota bacterium]